jgi:hypothetical protein
MTDTVPLIGNGSEESTNEQHRRIERSNMMYQITYALHIGFLRQNREIRYYY